jgi:hypothetical protein
VIRGGFRRNLIPKIEKRLDVSGSKPLVFRHRQDDGNVTVLAANHDGLALRIVQDCTESILGFCCGNAFHLLYLDSYISYYSCS